MQRSLQDRHTETWSKYFDRHGRLSQSEESECMLTHDKDGIARGFLKGATRGFQKPSSGNIFCLVFTYIQSLLIEKDGRARWNISIKFPCACPTVISSIFGKSFHFLFPYFVYMYLFICDCRFGSLLTYICDKYFLLH